MTEQSPIRCVAFDFDGTLVDSNPIKETAFFHVAASRGIDRNVVTQAYARLPRGNRYEIAALIADSIVPDGNRSAGLAEELATEYTAHCLDAVGTCAEVPGAELALQSLTGKSVLYLNSATPQSALDPILERRRWRGYFSGVLGGPANKLDNLRTIARREQLNANDIALVGDSDDDALAAAAFGCRFIGVTLRGTSRFSAAVNETLDDLHLLPAAITGEVIS